uniref:trimeric intracellular cation channel type B n=1 Tax=Euleptes europaea TaxID=460621 RepID=UPI00253FD791|nr:trimeric intracellular cation channel type B [Euleptes europaea]
MEPLLGEWPLRFSRLPMFPFFDMAHYAASVMSLKEQRGAVEISRHSPIACWFSAMLHCFGGSILSSLLLSEPPVAFLANTTNVLLASSVWYLIFYCPHDVFSRYLSCLPIRLLVSGMKEVTRTWKITGGVTRAHSHYQNAWIIMIVVGWARGAGGGLISNFEQLVRGVWKPETNELLKMSYPVKVSLAGAILFTMQHTHYLPMEVHDLMLFYTVFLVVTKVAMMLTEFRTSPFAVLENAVGSFLFGFEPSYVKVKGKSKVSYNGGPSVNEGASGGEMGDTVKKRHAKKTE